MKGLRKLAFMQAACLLLTGTAAALPASPGFVLSASAADYTEEEYEGFKIRKYETYVEIMRYIGEETEVTVPEKIDGLPVISLTYDALSWSGYGFHGSNITSVKLPKTLRNIGNNIFSGCEKLEQIEIPDSVTAIGDSVFSGCKALKTVKLSKKLKEIPYRAFYHCEGLEEISMPESVTKLGWSCFEGCSSLKSAHISSKMKVGADAFANCTSLTDVEIENGADLQGGAVFVGCKALETIALPDNLEFLNREMFRDCTGLKTIEIPSKCKTLDDSVFQNCSGLTEITVPEGCQSVSYLTFNNCARLEKITFLNPKCSIYKNLSTICNYTLNNTPYYDGVICGYEGSTAEAYAEAFELEFESLGPVPVTTTTAVSTTMPTTTAATTTTTLTTTAAPVIITAPPVIVTTPQQDRILVRLFEITEDHVKILLNQREMLPTETYSALLNYYASSAGAKKQDMPEDTVSVTGLFRSEDGYEQIDRYGRLISDQPHSVYYMTKEVPVHYLRFDAGEGNLVWQNVKTTYSGNYRTLAEDEIICPEQGKAGIQLPKAEWGDRAFLGWFTAPEGGEQITADTVISGEKEQTLYAHWDAEDTAAPDNTYYVRMYSMTNTEGTPTLSTIRKVGKGASYGKIWENYAIAATARRTVNADEFAPGTAAAYDWYTEKEGGMIIDRYSEEEIPGNTDIYYRREIYPCHYISFDAGEGELFWNVYSNYYEGNVAPAKSCEMTAMEAHRIGQLPDAENGTHAFLGWFTEPEGGEQVDARTVYTEKGDLKLYAHWDAEGTTEAPKGTKVRIYNVNSTTGEVTVYHDYRGEDCTSYHEMIYGRNSYGVATASPKIPDGTVIPEGTVYGSGYYTEAKGGDQITLYEPLLTNEDHAIYTRTDFVPYYHVCFDANGGQLFWKGYKSTAVYKSNETLKENEVTVIKGNTFSKVPTAYNGTRKFLGWFTKPDGGEEIETYRLINSYGSVNSYTYFNGDQDTTYYAHWDEDGTADPLDSVIMNIYQKEGDNSAYNFYGNYLVKSGSTYAEAARTASVSEAVSAQADVPAGKMLKSFLYTEPQGGICANSSTDLVPDHDFALYMRQEPVGYHYVSFDPVDGDLSVYDDEISAGQPSVMTTTVAVRTSSTTGTTARKPASDEIMVYEGAAYGTLKKAYQLGKKFLGWFTDPVGGSRVTEDSIFTGTADQTLYAHYGNASGETDETTATTSTTKATTTTTATTSTTKATTTTTATTSTTKATTTTTATTSTTKATTTTTATTSTTKATTTTATTSTTKATTTTTAATSTTKAATTTTATTSTTKATTITTVTETSETTVTTSETVPAEQTYLRGDVNNDGDVSVDDAQLTLNAYVKRMAGKATGLTEQQTAAADVNGDHAVTVEDAQTILLYYVKNTLSNTPTAWEKLLKKNAPASPSAEPKPLFDSRLRTIPDTVH